MATMSPREMRTVIIGVAVSLVALLARVVILPVNRYYVASVTALERERDLRRGEERLIAGRAEMANLARVLRDSIASTSGHLLKARAATTASMQLATRLREMALDEDVHGAHLTDLGSDSLAGRLQRVRVQIESQARFSQIVDLIAGIETDSLPMNVIDFEIAATAAATPRATGAAGNETGPPLRFRAVITAFARVEHRGTPGHF
jgi:hypothetical protein